MSRALFLALAAVSAAGSPVTDDPKVYGVLQDSQPTEGPGAVPYVETLVNLASESSELTAKFSVADLIRGIKLQSRLGLGLRSGAPDSDAAESSEEDRKSAIPVRVLEYLSNKFCTTIVLGNPTKDRHLLDPVNLVARESFVFIPNTLSRMGYGLVGQTVTACDWRGLPPRILASKNRFSPIVVLLQQPASDYDAVVFTAQHGQMVVPPQQEELTDQSSTLLDQSYQTEASTEYESSTTLL